MTQEVEQEEGEEEETYPEAIVTLKDLNEVDK